MSSFHIHLLVVDGAGRQVIPDSIKLITGRTAQEFNQRKKRGSSRINVKIIEIYSFLKIEYSDFIELSQNCVKVFVIESHYSALSQKRKGAFWEDRYHATAIQCDEHLIKCLTYIDLNMVRTGVVKHPSDWEFSGYNEIQNPRQRYRIIDYF